MVCIRWIIIRSGPTWVTVGHGHGDGRSRSRWWTVTVTVMDGHGHGHDDGRSRSRWWTVTLMDGWNGPERSGTKRNETKRSGTNGHGTVTFSAKNERFTVEKNKKIFFNFKINFFFRNDTCRCVFVKARVKPLY
jgi:hypothetical protein